MIANLAAANCISITNIRTTLYNIIVDLYYTNAKLVYQ
jgi:hypothetical protein